ncbi:hypothetical protein LCGC14_2679770 [marine sediment metagenome]|uniref:Uncharacterized protein n=1 Tax=marine sediment metagenome TaxID=412755 RepID=A0A0F8ZLP9_9ZZZZ
METKEELFRYGEVEHDVRVVGSMKGFRKYILPGNEIAPGVWDADTPEDYMTGDPMIRVLFEICEHPATETVRHATIANLGEVIDIYIEEGARCPRCKGVYKDGKWQ